MAETYQRNEGPTSEEILAQVNQVESRILELANQLDAIRRTDNNPFSSQPPPFLTETVPLAQSVEIISATQEVGTTHVAMSWTKPPRNDIDHFEIWAKNVAFASEQPFKVTDATDAPATFSLTADSDTGVVLFVRTVLKNGLGSDLNSSPTVATNITLEDPSITDPSQIADGIIGDSHFDRLSANAIQIVNADIVNLQATKITAGTLAAGVILASNINATQINAGTMSAVNVSGGTFLLTSSPNTMNITGSLGFDQLNTTTGHRIRLLNGGLFLYSSSGSTEQALLQATSDGAQMLLKNSSAQTRIEMSTGSGDEGLILLNADDSGTVVRIAAETSIGGQTDSGEIVVRDDSENEAVLLGVNGSGQGIIRIDGTKVIGIQGASVSDSSGGATVDAEARTAIEAIIDRLQAHGLIA